MILFLCFLLSFSLDWEDISNTQDSVWPHLQTPQIVSKILLYVSYFQLSYLCLEVWSNIIVFHVWYCSDMTVYPTIAMYSVRNRLM